MEVNLNEKRLKPEQLIGIVCGSVAAAFSIAGIAILVIRKKNSIDFSQDFSSSSNSGIETTATNTKGNTQETVFNTNIPNITNDNIDNFL